MIKGRHTTTLTRFSESSKRLTGIESLLRPNHQFKGWDVDVVGHSDNPTAGMPENWTTKKAKFEEPT
jgi:hypothetical protein